MNDLMIFYLTLAIVALALVILAVGTMKYGNPQNKKKGK